MNSTTKVKIICSKNHIFEQQPVFHLQGSKCSVCAGMYKTTESFITEANLKHNNKYDYSKFIYEKALLKSTIICSIHGEFLQTPSAHLRGAGCKKCSMYLSGWSKTKFVERCNINNKRIRYILCNSMF